MLEKTQMFPSVLHIFNANYKQLQQPAAIIDHGLGSNIPFYSAWHYSPGHPDVRLCFFSFEVGQCPQTRWQCYQTVCVSNPFAILKMTQRHHRALLPALQETQ